MKYFLQMSVILMLMLYGTEGAKWSYDHQDTWNTHYPNCGLKAQSPIAINTEKVIAKSMLPIRFINYNTALDAVITNNGHTAEITLDDVGSGTIPEISGGPLGNTRYTFVNAHFHWGAEHPINGWRHSVELHIVHRNTNYSAEDAINHADGFAVIAAFYRYGPYTHLHGLKAMFGAMPFIRHYGSNRKLKNFVLSSLIAGTKNLAIQKLYTYRGSFTTPPCSMAVEFLLFLQPIDISYVQYGMFLQLLDGNGQQIKRNYRTVQNQGDRIIYVNY